MHPLHECMRDVRVAPHFVAARGDLKFSIRQLSLPDEVHYLFSDIVEVGGACPRGLALWPLQRPDQRQVSARAVAGSSVSARDCSCHWQGLRLGRRLVQACLGRSLRRLK